MNSFINHGLIDQSVGRQDYCYLVQKLISYSYVFTSKNKSLHGSQVHTNHGKYIKFAKNGISKFFKFSKHGKYIKFAKRVKLLRVKCIAAYARTR